MIALDHIAIWSRNLFASTYRLSEQTGVGNRDGGFFPGLGLGQKVMSLGQDVYIEVESIANHRMILDDFAIARIVEQQTSRGDSFIGWCLRTNDYDDMEKFARIKGDRVMPDIPGGKFRMSGQTKGIANVPMFSDSWLIGKPNLYYVPDLSAHPSRLPIQPGTGNTVASGVTRLEIGGTRDGLRTWFDGFLDPDDFPFDLEYNGQPDGLYAVSFGTDDGEKTLRLQPVQL